MKVVYICLPRVLRWRNWNWFCGKIQFNNNWRVFKGTHELILFGSISSQLCLSLFFPPLAELTRWCSFACYMPTHMIIPVFVPYAALAFSVQNLAMSPKKVPPLLFTSDTEKKKCRLCFGWKTRIWVSRVEKTTVASAYGSKSEQLLLQRVLGDSKHCCQCRAEPRETGQTDTTFCVLLLLA